MSLYPDWVDEDIEMVDESEEVTQEGYGYLYDYNNNRVITTIGGKTTKTSEHDAYLYWAYKTVATERFSRAAYSSDFGVEIEAILERDYDRDVAESEIARSITEALEVDDRTKKVSDFVFSWDGDVLHVTFTLDSIYNTDTINVQRGGEQ